jgi:Na+/H+ antiporter NhaD/arsenite permease-like protein
MLAAEREVERETPMMVMSFLFSVFGLQALGVLDVFAKKIGQNPSVTVVILVLIGLALASSFIDNIPLAAVTLVLFGSITNPVFWVMAAMLLSIGGNYLLIGSAAGFLVMGSKQLKGVVTFASFAKGMFLPQTVAFALLATYASVVIYITLG